MRVRNMYLPLVNVVPICEQCFRDSLRGELDTLDMNEPIMNVPSLRTNYRHEGQVRTLIVMYQMLLNHLI